MEHNRRENKHSVHKGGHERWNPRERVGRRGSGLQKDRGLREGVPTAHFRLRFIGDDT